PRTAPAAAPRGARRQFPRRGEVARGGRAMTESRSAAASRVGPAEEPRSVRVALSPYVFRGMLVGMAAVAVAMHRLTGNRRLTWNFAKARARTLERMLGVHVQVTGLEHVATGGPFVFTPNHQSHPGLVALLGHLPGAPRFVAKESLWRHAVVGAVLDSLGMVPIDRESSADAVATLNRVRDEGESFVVFPEGTRSRDGRLNEF